MWFFFALLGALGKSYSGFFRKKMAGNVGAAMYMWLSYSLILLVLTPFMFGEMSEVLGVFKDVPLLVFGAAFPLLLATYMNLEALKREDLSYTAPLNAFVPVFTIIIAYVFLQEKPPELGILGVVIVVLGAYVVSLKPVRIHWYEPLFRLLGSTGAQLSLGVALGYAINTVCMKAISNEGYGAFTIMYAITLLGWVFVAYVPFVKREELKIAVRSNKYIIFGAAASSFFANYFHIVALGLTYASYVVSVRRLDAVISVLLGWRFLKESNIRYKITGSIITTVGAIIIALS